MPTTITPKQTDQSILDVAQRLIQSRGYNGFSYKDVAAALGRNDFSVPASLSEEVGLALGAQAGESRLREVVTAAGFTRFRRATETPFNLILEARP